MAVPRTDLEVTELSIGRLADAAGVSVETVRYYERRGLLDPPARTASGYRRYLPADLDRLRLLLRAKELGFTLAESCHPVPTAPPRGPLRARRPRRLPPAAADGDMRRMTVRFMMRMAEGQQGSPEERT
jgi:hypothetical protein